MKHLSDQALLIKMDNLVQQERELVTAVLQHLCEIQRRRLFCDLGFPSLFAYAVEKLGYSHDQAYRRISASRLLKQFPELEEKLESGAMTLTNVSLAASFFKRESMTVDKKRAFLETLENKSSREAEKIIVATSPKPHTPDRVTAVSSENVEFRFIGPAHLQKKLDQLKGLLAHSHPNISLGELVEKLAYLGLKEWDPGKPTKRERKQSVKTPSPKAYKTSQSPESNKTEPSPNQFKEESLGAPINVENSKKNPAAPAAPDPDRAIPKQLQREIWKRDQGKCQNCESLYALEIDHIRPIALGGDASPENLRLLCRACNQRAAIQKLGRHKMEKFI